MPGTRDDNHLALVWARCSFSNKPCAMCLVAAATSKEYIASGLNEPVIEVAGNNEDRKLALEEGAAGVEAQFEATQSTETPLELLLRKMRDTAAAPTDRWRLSHSALSCRQWLTGFVTGTATMGALGSAAPHSGTPPDETAVGRESVRRAPSSCGSCAPVAERLRERSRPLLSSTPLLSSRFG
jgi:hypothetical protein